jgi:spermidine synthase
MNGAPLFLFYLNVLIIATCGLIYELLAGTLASYLLGDSVTQFSLVIGIYLSALGVGAWLSSFVEEKLARCFIEIELAVALVGGTSAPMLFLAFGYIDWFRPLLYGLVFTIGVLVGLELPLLMRLLKEHVDFSDLVSRVLTFDYIGALLAALLFPILLVPHLGLVRTSLVFGIFNALVALWGTYLLRPLLSAKVLGGLRGRAVLVIGLLLIGIIKADAITTVAEENQLAGNVVHAESSPYQRIVITENRTGFQLFLNGHLQFNSADEYRYHEALVHPAMGACRNKKHILVMGGGDGLAVREILRYSTVESVTLVDLDLAMTSLADRFPPLEKLTGDALRDSRVTVINQDAFLWVDKTARQFDAVIIDFPDPGTYSVGKLYTSYFFTRLRQRMAPGAAVSIQCSSPLVSPESYWCVINTLEQSGFRVRPFQATVPTFGVWGFALAAIENLPPNPQLAPYVGEQLRFLDQNVLDDLFMMPRDMRRVETEVNRLNNQVLVRYYDREWSRWQ